MTASRMSAFFWDTGEASIFSDDPHFTPRSNGLTHAQTSSVVSSKTVERITRQTGRNPGTQNLRRSESIDQAWARKSGVR